VRPRAPCEIRVDEEGEENVGEDSERWRRRAAVGGVSPAHFFGESVVAERLWLQIAASGGSGLLAQKGASAVRGGEVSDE